MRNPGRDELTRRYESYHRFDETALCNIVYSSHMAPTCLAIAELLTPTTYSKRCGWVSI